MRGDDYAIYGLTAVSGAMALLATVGKGAQWGAEPSIGLGLLLLGVYGLISILGRPSP